MVWHKLFVKGNHNSLSMKKVDETLNMFGAFVKCPEGTCIQEDDGTWEVRIMQGMPLSIAKSILSDNGLEIVREEESV